MNELANILQSLAHETGWDRVRIRLTEHVARLDDALTLSIAVHYGRTAEHVLSLLQDVFWRLPVEVRIGLLDDALWRTGLHDEVPFLVPCLRAVFRIRNSLAHGVTLQATASYLSLRKVKRGRFETEELSAERLNWAVAAAEICSLNFMRIEGRLGSIEVWSDLYAFSER